MDKIRNLGCRWQPSEGTYRVCVWSAGLSLYTYLLTVFVVWRCTDLGHADRQDH